jgi:hypothetical protein
MLPVYLLLTWCSGKLASDALRSTWIPRIIVLMMLGGILFHSMLYGFTVNMMYSRDPRYAAETWMAENIKPGMTIIGIEPGYSLPRFPKEVTVVWRALWDFHGTQVGDIIDVKADYVVLGMSIPRRREMKERIGIFFTERGYEEFVVFKSELPFFGREIPNMHIINPCIVVLRRIENG